jgi:sulfite reductase (NADPH) flavoprotein alpha-component
MNHSTPNLPIPDELAQHVANLSSLQQSFLSGYLWAKVQANGAGVMDGSAIPFVNQGDAQAANSGSVSTASVDSDGPVTAPSGNITVISASQTGNAAGLAKQLVEKLKGESLQVKLVSAGGYKARQIAKEDMIIIATSTQGDGEPPEEGVPLHSYLFGKKAPSLGGLSFAVLGLGDSSYPKFCQAGIDFDTQLEKLGAKRILDRLDADVDFETAAEEWINKAVAKVKEQVMSAVVG